MTLAMLGWGLSWINVKILADYITENEFVTYRFVISFVTMIPVLYWLKLPLKISLKSLLLAIISAALLVVYTKLFFLGTKYGTAGLSAAIVTTLMPIIVYILTMFGKQRKTSAQSWFMLILGAVGVLTMMKIWSFDRQSILSLSNIYLLVAALSWALLSIASSYEKQLHPIVLSTYIYLLMVIIDVLFFFDPSSGSIFVMDSIFWLNLLAISIISTTFATTVYFAGLQKLGSKKGSVFTFLVPFFAIGLGVIFLAESMTFSTLAGVIMVIIALLKLKNT